MRFCYLPTSKIKPNPKNIFPPLEGEEYEDLKESIGKHGILEPLIVDEGDHGEYVVRVGDNRLRAACELGMSEVPCFIDDSITVEAAIDSNICGRQLTPAERKKYKDLKEKMVKEEMDAHFQEKLVPQLYEKYTQGMLPERLAVMLTKYGREEQTTFLHSFKEEILVGADDDIQEKLTMELQQTKEQVQTLKEALQAKEVSLEELRKREVKARELLGEKLAELEKAKLNISKIVKKEYEQEIQELQKNLKDLSRQIKEKNDEIERAKEHRDKAERVMKDREAEMNAAMLKVNDYKETCKNLLQKIAAPQLVLNRLQWIASEMDILAEHVIRFTWEKNSVMEVERMAEAICRKVKRVAKDMREHIVADHEDVPQSTLDEEGEKSLKEDTASISSS